MPPLKGEIFTGTPKSEGELELEARVKALRNDTRRRMNAVLPMPVKSRRHQIETAKAIYQADGQLDNERTRAWVRRHGESSGRGGSTLYLVTDTAVVTPAGLLVVPNSETTHFGLQPEAGPMFTEYYLGQSDLQNIELIEAALDTLALIEEAKAQQVIQPAIAS